MGGEGRQQRHLLGGEGPLAPVSGEQHADDYPPDHERDAQDRDEALAGDGPVDLGRVVELVVREVVGGRVRAQLLRDEAPEPRAQAEADGLELVGADALGDPHVGVAPGLVEQGQVAGVGTEKLARPPHDRHQHPIEVAQRRQVARGLVQRTELTLAPLSPRGREGRAASPTVPRSPCPPPGWQR